MLREVGDPDVILARRHEEAQGNTRMALDFLYFLPLR
jgi:hypothetical protein